VVCLYISVILYILIFPHPPMNRLLARSERKIKRGKSEDHEEKGKIRESE
jgi:hypothetical protein